MQLKQLTSDGLRSAVWGVQKSNRTKKTSKKHAHRPVRSRLVLSLSRHLYPSLP